MKKIIISFLLIVGLVTAVHAQSQLSEQRTRETKIADIVMLLPANNTESFNQLMNELSQLGDVVADLAPRLSDPGGNDAQIRYAISGLTMYASKSVALSTPIAKSLCEAITKAKSDEIRDFLFIQLQYVAGAESATTAAQYLTNDRLCDAAARVLVRINTNQANTMLLTALIGAKNIPQQITLVESLGYTRYADAADAISALVESSDIRLRKTALHALAEIASPASEKTLATAASKVGYAYEPSDALGAYLLYLENALAKKDPKATATIASASKKMLKATSENTQIAAKSAALDIYARSAGDKAIGDLTAALNSDNKQYREAALKSSASIPTNKMYDALMKKAKGEKRTDVKAEIVTALGARGNKAALPFILDCLSTTNSSLRQAAIVSAGRLGETNVIPSIIKAMNTGDEQVVATGKSTLLNNKSDNVVSEIAAAIPNTSTQASVAFMEILASRKAEKQIGSILAQTTATDAKVRLAANKALASVVTEKDVPRVAQLLNATSNKEETAALQEALHAAVSALPQAEQTKLVSAQMNTTNQADYYNVLAMVGGQDALATVMNGFKGTDAKQRDAAFEALTRWSDGSAITTLYQVAATNPAYADKALMSYVSKVNTSKNTPEQKLIQLRNALDIAKLPAQKQDILRQIARTGTFLGLLTSSKYLDDTDNGVQQAAVQAVRAIALAHPEYSGSDVTALLNKAMAVNKDPEADYQKQAILKHMTAMSKDGFVSMFNGKDLSGWKGLVENPIARAKMTAKQLTDKQKKADEIMRRDWRVENGLLVFDGKGYDNLCSEKTYGDFEMYVDWRITAGGDAGIYLRGTPQVQIWDIALTKVGAQVGSGGLYNNQKHRSTPLLVADNPVNEWNSFYIKMVGDKVTVYFNGQLVTDNVVMENYWNRELLVPSKDAIELQAHGERVEYRDVYVREIPRPEPYEVSAAEKTEGFAPMFNGVDMSGWVGNLTDYIARDGMIVCDPSHGGRGNLYTEKEYANFVMRFDFQLTPAANNGLGIRTPLEGDAAYMGMELQILDNDADVYKDLKIHQYHGSVYGVIPAKRGYLKPLGEWNTQEVIAKGNRITITLNGTVILDGDLSEASKKFTQTLDGQKHPGLSNKSGHIGFLGHGSEVAFRNLRIKTLK